MPATNSTGSINNRNAGMILLFSMMGVAGFIAIITSMIISHDSCPYTPSPHTPSPYFGDQYQTPQIITGSLICNIKGNMFITGVSFLALAFLLGFKLLFCADRESVQAQSSGSSHEEGQLNIDMPPSPTTYTNAM